MTSLQSIAGGRLLTFETLESQSQTVPTFEWTGRLKYLSVTLLLLSVYASKWSNWRGWMPPCQYYSHFTASVAHSYFWSYLIEILWPIWVSFSILSLIDCRGSPPTTSKEQYCFSQLMSLQHHFRDLFSSKLGSGRYYLSYTVTLCS